jgi:hypothetical protein
LRSITVAWCKNHLVPIEKIFTKVLLEKFGVRAHATIQNDTWLPVRVVYAHARAAHAQWSMEAEPAFDF